MIPLAGKKSKTAKEALMKYLRSFYKRHRGMAALALLLLLGQVVGTLLIPALIANVVDLGILPGDMDAILRTGGQMLAVALLSAAVAAAGSWVTADLGARFGFEMRSLLLRKSQELSLHQFDEVGVSSMITRTTSDITNLQQTMGMVLQMVVPAPLIVGASIVMTAMVTPVMAVIQVGFMAALAAVAAVVLRKSNALSRSIQVRLDRINRVVREAVTGVRVIRAFGNEAYEEARSGDAYRSYADNMIRLNRLFAVAIPVVWMLMGALMAVVLWAGGVLTLGGGMEVGQITAVTEYSILTMGYLLMAVSVLTTLPKARACLARLTALLDIQQNAGDQVSKISCGEGDKSEHFSQCGKGDDRQYRDAGKGQQRHRGRGAALDKRQFRGSDHVDHQRLAPHGFHKPPGMEHGRISSLHLCQFRSSVMSRQVIIKHAAGNEYRAENEVQKGVCCPVEDRTRRPDPDHKIPNAGCFPLAWNSDKFLIHVVPGDGGTAQIIDQVQQD